ncbi:MAG: hypothetical protein NC828_03090 [Candidatus Omnitrophica bacterium]|nr:hypothetical protein [Candidatus Omnitrophota bacterium]
MSEAKRKQIIQKHHVIYPSEKHPDQEYVVVVTKGEHMLLSKIDWFTRNFVSQGFITALEIFIAKNRSRAMNLELIEK